MVKVIDLFGMFESEETMTKIVFYGASVTQQRNGYVDHFAKLSKAQVMKLGFGGMHLNDAGICFVDKAVQTRPDICFIDWFSTAYTGLDSKSDLYIDAIAEKFLKINHLLLHQIIVKTICVPLVKQILGLHY